MPLETFAVVPGTRVLVRLEDELNTGECKSNYRFKVRTMEPLEAGSGFYLPAGAEIRAHVSKVEPAGITGRAKLFLVFDEIKTRFGILPIVADVVDVPGDHSVKTSPGAEGVIQGRQSTQQAAGQAAAEGAGIGAVGGAAAGGAIGSAFGRPGMGAAIGAGTGLLGGALIGDYMQGQEEYQYNRR